MNITVMEFKPRAPDELVGKMVKSRNPSGIAIMGVGTDRYTASTTDYNCHHRVTPCCHSFSTIDCDSGILYCKVCYEGVHWGEGDGSEDKPFSAFIAIEE